MADYNLHGLNTRDFQHLVQAIARKQIAPGVTAFGDGKDGNRDLTFTGKMNYPSLTSPWDGYLVLGCKFCQRPTGDSKKDGDWAVEQLQADLKKFLNRKRNLPKPEYYLFATNIPLTAVANKGSRDSISALLAKYSQKLRLKGHGVWDYHDIRGFLDGDQSVRVAYGHLVTAGDVLARIADVLQTQKLDFANVMQTFLQKELIADAAAKLQSAGEDPDVQIPLASVFVDLPYADSPEAATLAKQEDENSAPRVVQHLLQASSLVLRRHAGAESLRTDVESASAVLPRSRFVIVGGPGQGKSTLGHLYLMPLSPKHALGYGRKLAESRCGGDERRRDELVRGLEKACKSEATARLMQSPLQVTIMATLIEDTGDRLAGRAAKATLWGARLALEILTDGTARQYPEYEVRLARLALALIRTGDAEVSALLAAVWHNDLSELYREAINDRLGQTNFWVRLGAWNLLLSLADRGVEWATELSEENWPGDAKEQAAILASREHTSRGQWWIKKISATAPRLEPWWLQSHVVRYDFERLSRSKGTPESWRILLRNLFARPREFLQAPNRLGWLDLFQIFVVTPLRLDANLVNAIGAIKFEHPGWFPQVSGARFARTPSADSLAAELSWLAANWQPEIHFSFGLVPWPLGACIKAASSRDELTAMAKRASKGGLGQLKDWTTAETRWKRVGITEKDLAECTDDRWPFDASIADSGFPFAAAGWSSRKAPDNYKIDTSIERLHLMRRGKLQAWLAATTLGLYKYPWADDRRALSPKQYRDLYQLSGGAQNPDWWKETYWLDNMARLSERRALSEDDINLIEWIGRKEHRFLLDRGNPSLAGELAHHFCINPAGKQGLLPAIVRAVASGGPCTVPRQVLETANNWSRKSKESVNTLSLSLADLSEDEIIESARELTSADSSRGAIRLGMQIAGTVSPERQAAFALAVLDSLSSDSEERSDDSVRAHRVLVEFLTSRRSNFDVSRLCSGLSLPDMK